MRVCVLVVAIGIVGCGGSEPRANAPVVAVEPGSAVVNPDRPPAVDPNAPRPLVDPRDGKTYRLVTIGKRRWTAENMGYVVARGSYCYGELERNCTKYGRLYEWDAAMQACPSGWHVPTED